MRVPAHLLGYPSLWGTIGRTESRYSNQSIVESSPPRLSQRGLHLTRGQKGVLAPHTCLCLFSIWVYVNLHRYRVVRDFVAHCRSLGHRCVHPVTTYDDTSTTLASHQFNPNSVGKLEDTTELPYCTMTSYERGTRESTKPQNVSRFRYRRT